MPSMPSVSLSRRTFLLGSAAAGAAVAAPALWPRFVHSSGAPRLASSRLPRPFTIPLTHAPLAEPAVITPLVDYYRFRMYAVQAEIIPGFQTTVWSYNGHVPGPTLRTPRGRGVVAQFINELPSMHPDLGYEAYTSIHLHGAASKPQYDGYASDIIHPTQFKTYRWANNECARPLWYHDHAVHHTWSNLQMGLAARYFIDDPDDAQFQLPTGEYDVSLHICDAMFRADGQLLLDLEDLKGFWGDVILVNGKPWPVMKVQRRKYRFSVLNGCVARSLFWRLSTGDPFTVVGTDDGLVPTPIPVTRIRQTNAERYDVVIDFAKYKPGTRITMINDGLKYNEEYTNTNKIMAFEVTDEPFDPSNNTVPEVLRPDNPVMTRPVPPNVRVRRFRTERQGGEWTVNGDTWHDVINSNYRKVAARVALGSTEIWEFHNSSGGWSHPMHVHGVDARLLTRNGRPPYAYERGPKDTFLVGENETIRVLIHFELPGKYMIHCHNAVHEDHDMMVQYEVVDPVEIGDDPFSAQAEVYTGQDF